MDEFKKLFIGDAKDIISSMEIACLKLEKDNNNLNIINEIFRGLHSLKGAAGMFGFEVISEYVHGLENIYDLIR